jgi:hypothetical protein
MNTEYIQASENPILPISNEFKFHGTLEEFKKYLPELYEKMMKENEK